MALPKIQYPIVTFAIPNSKEKYTFRPMLVKEEKLLLMAKESEEPTDVLQAIRQVVNNCCMDSTFNVDTIPLYALEYLFLNLRAVSVGDVIKVSYRDYEDDQTYDFEINIKSVEVKFPEKSENKVKITDKSGIVLKYPMASLYTDKAFLDSKDEETFYKLVTRCIDRVYDGDQVYEGKDFSEAELQEFVELLDIKTFDRVREFLLNVPSLYYKIEYKNSLGNPRSIEMKTLSDFFTLR
jgi:hypothetical protein